MDGWGITLGAIIGVCTSITAWLIVFRAFAPRLKWSNELTRRERAPGNPVHWRYAMNLTNAGLFRSAVAVTIQVRARMPLPYPGTLKQNGHNFVIPTDTPFVPYFPVRRKLPWRRGRGSLYGVVLRLRDIDERDLNAVPLDDELKERIRGGHAQLEELLDAGMTLRFYAWGYDSMTGAFTVRRSERIHSSADVEVIPPPAEAVA